MTFMFQPASSVVLTRPLLIGLAGGTGSGKTYSALRLAQGLANGGKVAGIDTENGRMLEYKREFPDLLYGALKPPYSPMAYLEAMEAAAKVAKVVIVDSVSHEWEGSGGMLEWANTIAEKMAAKAQENAGGRYAVDPDKYTFPSWKEPKMAHQRMVAWMISAPCHLILCFRAKEKKGFEEIEFTRKNGQTGKKKEIVDLGWQPITEVGLPYEMSFLATFLASKPGVPEFTFKALSHIYNGIFNGQPLSQEHGKQLAALMEEPPSAPTPPPKPGADAAGNLRNTLPASDPAAPPADEGSLLGMVNAAHEREQGKQIADTGERAKMLGTEDEICQRFKVGLSVCYTGKDVDEYVRQYIDEPPFVVGILKPLVEGRRRELSKQ